MTINEWCTHIDQWGRGKGFITSKGNMLAKLMLVVTECAEAAEDVRHERWDHFPEELADIVIRCFNIAGALNIDLEKAIETKMEVNHGRPYRHGTKSSA